MFSHPGSSPLLSKGEPAGSCVLPALLGPVAGLQPALGACGLWGGFGHHADWSAGLLSGSALERQAKVHL